MSTIRGCAQPAVWAALAAIAAGAQITDAAAPIRVTASPPAVSRGARVSIRGSGWAVIEFCKPRVTLTLRRSAPLAPLAIATVNLRTGPTTSGTFAASWMVPRTVHTGLRTIVATQRCESGKNGSVNLVTRTTSLRVR
jgi:hypothetical protein